MIVLYLLWGGPSFVGWFLLIYSGEMALTWATIVPDHPDLAVTLAWFLMIPAASLAWRKALKAIDRHMRFP